MRLKLILISLLLFTFNSQADIPVKIQNLIEKGEFNKAQQEMRQELATNSDLDPESRLHLQFEIERLERFKKDFQTTKQQVIDYIKQYIPKVSEQDLDRWEKERSLEYWIIDGQKRYFNRAAPNLFRINREARKIKQQKTQPQTESAGDYDRLHDVENMVNLAITSGEMYINPVRFQITYTLQVNENAVPPGYIIRCWLPYPRNIPNRQTDVQLISTSPQRYIIADNEDFLQRTIYLEKKAQKDQKTKFQVVFNYTSYAIYNQVNPDAVKSIEPTEALASYLSERPPHIVFTPELTALSRKIVGDETNPYRIAQKIFQWIDENIPWASAREYSTFRNVSDYVLQNRHADCGMQTIFLMTLCRMNGIPTRWQSGWTTEPGDEGMHDWGEIYFEPYGWLPVDVTYGLMTSNDNRVKWYFLGSMDTYRLIVNDDYSQPLYPAKMFPRSETIDFQRGEVEWEGGNLYFDQWEYDFDVQIISD